MRCTYCEKEFRAVRRDTLFCSRACRQAAYRARRRPLIEDIKENIHQARLKAAQTKRQQELLFICLYCGREYTVNGNQVRSQYCSSQCRHAESRGRTALLKHFLIQIASESPR